MEFPAPTIIHADADLLVVDKPAGILSIPDGYDRAVPYLGGVLEPSYGRLWVVHRLDKETSGVMVFARNERSHKALSTQFSSYQVSKTYHVLIDGNPDWEENTIEVPLRTNVGRRNRTAVDIANGKDAVTHFRVLERFPRHALLAAYPKTGRTHQIRVHIYDLGYSILSDPLYGLGNLSPFIGRLALHALSLSIWHPTTGELITFEAQYPKDFNEGVHQLRLIASASQDGG